MARETRSVVLATLVRPGLVLLDHPARASREIYAAVAGALVADGRLPANESGALVERLAARERMGGIALGQGLALPHATHPSLDAPLVAIVRLAQPLDIGAPDRRPADLWLVLTGAEGDPRAHLQALARLALLLRHADGLAAIRAARTPHAVVAAVAALDAPAAAAASAPGTGQRLLVVVLNDTGRLHDAIEALAEAGVRGATIIESRGMGRILAQDIPIFAGFRHLMGGSRPFNYTILSVVPDATVAQAATTRLRGLLGGDAAKAPGVAFTVPVDAFGLLGVAPGAPEAPPAG